MKTFPNLCPVCARLLLLSFAFCLGACRETPRLTDPADAEPESDAAAAPQDAGTTGAVDSPGDDTPPPHEQIAELRRAIESAQENIENLDAFVQMERAKVENDPEYQQSFLQEALDEQKEIQETIETIEERLQEILRQNE